MFNGAISDRYNGTATVFHPLWNPTRNLLEITSSYEPYLEVRASNTEPTTLNTTPSWRLPLLSYSNRTNMTYDSNSRPLDGPGRQCQRRPHLPSVLATITTPAQPITW